MKDINRLLKDYYYADGSEKRVIGEKWTTKHRTNNTREIEKRRVWKELLTQMNLIRNENPEIQLSYEQRGIVKSIVYNINYHVGRYNSEQINLIIIIYIFNYLYGRDFNFSKYLDDYDLDKRKVEHFILKYIKKIGE